MFECSACTLRCIRAIAGDTPGANALTKGRFPRIPNQPLRRYAATSIATRTAGDDFVPFESPKKAEENAKKRPNAVVISNKAVLMKELDWLTDRVKLAQHVHYTLRNNDPVKALNLCRLASKKEEVIVSWNHVIDWHMKNGQVEKALTVYNEMKKRAQFPDSYTYTLILRGLANSSHDESRGKNVVRAVSIYNSLSSPTSRVKPSILHTNAVLQVCAQALDMDALWGIVAKMPESGSGAADAITYSIILNGIRNSCMKNEKGYGDADVEGMKRRRNRAVLEGRTVWRDVITKWRSGEIQIDENLVVQMARLLLLSVHMQDWDDVFNLFQQTMKIERLVPALGSPDRKIEHVPSSGLPAPQEDVDAEEDMNGFVDAPATKVFQPVKPFPRDRANPRRPTSLVWVQPGTQTLRVLLDTCTVLRTPKAASQYWDVLTSQPFIVQPKTEDAHLMLRLHYKNRSSAKAVAFIKDGLAQAGLQLTASTLVLGISICVRDIKNSHALGNARQLVDVMREAPGMQLVPGVLVHYMMIALATDDPVKIIETVDDIHPSMEELERHMATAESFTDYWEAVRKTSSVDEEKYKQDGMHLFNTMVGTINMLRDLKLVPEEKSGALAKKRTTYQRVINHLGAQDRSQNAIGQGASRKRKIRRLNGEKNRDDEDNLEVYLGSPEPALRAFRRRHVERTGGKMYRKHHARRPTRPALGR